MQEIITNLLEKLKICDAPFYNYREGIPTKLGLVNELKNLILLESLDINVIIQYCIENFHDTNLINQNEAPNANLIYIFWNDGEITYEKGSWAFGQRSVFPIEYAFIHDNKPTFPFKRNSYTGIITTQERCYFLRFLYEIKLQKIF